MKGFLAILVGTIVLAIAAPQVITPANATQSSQLPPAQRTAVYAPAVATQSAGTSLTNNANAQAAAQEAEAARVYAQAQADEQNKARAVATQQALFATQTANDIAVSKEYATLAAVSIQATSEAISRTISYEAEQYRAGVVAIQATREAAQAKAFDEMTKTNAADSIGYFWTWIPTAAALILFALFVLVLWKLISNIEPRIEIEEREVLVPVAMPSTPDEPPLPIDEAKREIKRAEYRLAKRYVADSIRKNGGQSNKLLSATEWEAIGSNRESHTAAMNYLKGISGAVRVQTGGKADEQGTYVQEAGKDLVYLLTMLLDAPPP